MESHLKTETFLARHMHCVTIEDCIREYKRSPGYEVLSRNTVKAPNGNILIIKAVCDHPEDGKCGRSINQENLETIKDPVPTKTKSPRTPRPRNMVKNEDLQAAIARINSVARKTRRWKRT